MPRRFAPKPLPLGELNSASYWRCRLSSVRCRRPTRDSRASLRRSGRALDKESRSEFYSRAPRLAAHAPRLDQSAETRRRRGISRRRAWPLRRLPNPDSDTPGLPVGFLSVSEPDGVKTLAMTCSACHTRQIEIDGAAWRIDGGPGIVDIGSFFADLDAAYAKVLSEEAAFTDFSNAVLGASASKDTRDKSNNEVKAWFRPFNMLMQNGLPKPPGFPWGPARLDAVGLMFYRIAGLDIGAPSDLMHYRRKYRTRRCGRALSVHLERLSSRPHAMAWLRSQWRRHSALVACRPSSWVSSAFFIPRRIRSSLEELFSEDLSLNFSGLLRLETLSKQIGPPKWPRPETIDQALVAEGKKIFDRNRRTAVADQVATRRNRGRRVVAIRTPWRRRSRMSIPTPENIASSTATPRPACLWARSIRAAARTSSAQGQERRHTDSFRGQFDHTSAFASCLNRSSRCSTNACTMTRKIRWPSSNSSRIC